MKSDLQSIKEREKASLLTVVAYSAHNIALEATRSILEEKEILNFRLYEFFASPPIVKNKGLQPTFVHAPFLRRIAEKESEIVPDISEITTLVNRSLLDLSPEQKSNLIAPRSSRLLLDYFKLGTKFHFNEHASPKGHKLWTEWEKKKKTEKIKDLNYGFWTKNDLKEYLSSILKFEIGQKGIDKNDKIGLLMEYFLCDYIYENSKLEKLGWVAVPIASESVFYGYIFSVIPTDDEEGVLKKVEKELGKRAKDYFLPTLVLFENQWEEKILKEVLKNGNGDWQSDHIVLKGKNGNYSIPKIFLHTKDSKEVLERKLNELWSKRSNAKGNMGEEWKKKNLIFYDFVTASRKMIEKIRDQIVQLNPKKIKKKLPTVLVIGGPGSGKDTIAKMIPLFSEHYYKCERYPINLASLKPPQIAPSLLMGLDIDVRKEKLSSLSLEGMFWRIIEIEKKKKGKNKGEIPAVIMLDELNSLDIDTQGVLLRFIENSELIPIGSVESAKMEPDFLLIGMMNEDPEHLTKESFLRQFIMEGKGSSFGKVMSEILYEHFRKIRRLREDLYHRFIRGGKITLPTLEERKEDIPILFYMFCKDELIENKDELKEEMKDKNKENEKSSPQRLYIPFEILDILTSLPWPGNVRQLQALAPIVMRYAKSDFKNKDKEILKIEKRHVLEALKEIDQ